MNKRFSHTGFRKCLSAVLAVCLTAACLLPATAETADVPANDVYYGDVNGDGTVNVIDALLILQRSVGRITFTYDQILRANGNGDTKVDASDALLTLQRAVRLIDRFPVEQTMLDTVNDYIGENPLRFNEDGGFTVLQISDPMLTAGDAAGNAKTTAAINALITAENPDFVMFSGDMATGYANLTDLRTDLTAMVSKLETDQIPWAHVFGPSDVLNNKVSTTLQQVIYQGFHSNISRKDDDKTVSGTTNYVLPVLDTDGNVALNLWAIDTGSSLSKREDGLDTDDLPNEFYPTGDEDFVDFSQILWYCNTSDIFASVCKQNIPGIMFGSVPFQEFQMIAKNPLDGYMQGSANENVTGSKINSGLFTALLEQGDVKGYYCGYNRTNNFSGKYCGLNLGYAGSVGYGANHKESVMGGRVFQFNQSNPAAYTSYFSYLKNLDSQFTTELTDADRDTLASAYKTDKNTVMLNDFDALDGISEPAAAVTLETGERSQGASSLKLVPAGSGEQLSVSYAHSTDVSGYDYISLDVYAPKKVTAGGTLQVRFAGVNAGTGATAEIPLTGLKAGWNTLSFAKADLSGTGSWSTLRNIVFTLDGAAPDADYLLLDNLKISNPTLTYQVDKKTLMINSFETTALTETSYLTNLSSDSNCTQGMRSMRLSPTKPVGQGANVGAMAFFYPETALDLTPYQYIGFDLFVSNPAGLDTSIFQVNFATSGGDGFNVNTIGINGLIAGWNHIELERSAIEMAVSADWSSINTIRMTWFNNSQTATNCYFLIDNMTAYNK